MSDDGGRLAALRRYDVLDTPCEPEFDDLVRLAARACEAPVAVISLVDDRRQWFKAEVRLDVRETSLVESICAQTIRQPGLFVVPDASNPDGAREELVHIDYLPALPSGRMGTIEVVGMPDGRLFYRGISRAGPAVTLPATTVPGGYEARTVAEGSTFVYRVTPARLVVTRDGKQILADPVTGTLSAQ